MLAIYLYIKERFPIPAAFLFSFGYSVLTLGVSFNKNVWKDNLSISIINILILSSVFFFFLLRQRAIDEFRDAEHDRKYFPDRPVPRGLISKKQVLFIGLFAFTIELISAYTIGKHVFGLYILFFLYSLSMAKEFFIPRWLNKHFTTYFLIHEVIFLLFGLFSVYAINPHLISFNLQALALLVILTAAPMGIEVIRKFKPRYDKSGKAVADTYGTVWGRNNALLVLIGLSLIVGIGLGYLKHSYIFLLFSFIVIAALLVMGKKSNPAVTAIGAINFLGFAILANLIW